ncbi:transferase family-domain-containing protein [Phyllosticta capitalensis]|uniref:Transferase family-domain-containing protein n=1 Tax=Phyllosticta capitalensis TaxID=121624 RepID=A0ABR1Z164_9PEZI
MARKETLRVSSSDPANESGTEEFPLSDLDHIISKIYVPVTLVYKLEDHVDRQQVIEKLRSSLQVTLSQYPCLRGSLRNDESSNRLFIRKEESNTVPFNIHWLDEQEDDFPSYEMLEKKEFPPSLLDVGALFPSAVFQKQIWGTPTQGDDDDKKVLVVQANFIRGGLILGVAVQHNCADGAGIDGFLCEWAGNARRVSEGERPTPIDPLIFDRSPLFSTVKEASSFARALADKSALKKLSDMPPMPEDFKMPSLSQVIFHFPSAGIARLKEDAKLPGQNVIGSYDAICAIIWRCMIRARLPLLNPDMAATTRFGHTVNARKFLEPALPPRYFGNVVMYPRVDMKVSELLGDGSLPHVVSTVRPSIQEQLSPAAVKGLCDWISSVDRKANTYVDTFMGLDMAMTDWSQMSTYQEHDFGFGLPKAVRWPNTPLDGFLFRYPRRPKDDPTEGFELGVFLETSCMERLIADEELAKYAHPRGL